MSKSRTSASSGTQASSPSMHRENSSRAPLNPSRLWQSHGPGSSLDDETSLLSQDPAESFTDEPAFSPRTQPVEFGDDGIHPQLPHIASPVEDEADTHIRGVLEEPSEEAHAHTLLMESYDQEPGCGSKICNHGTFSPRPTTQRSIKSSDGQFDFRRRHQGGTEEGTGDNNSMQGPKQLTIAGRLFGARSAVSRMSTTQFLAKKHGIKSTRLMYVAFSCSFFIVVEYKSITSN